MKTKQEILEAIKRLRGQKTGYAYTKSKPYQDISSGQIRALRWVLGYKVGEWYWCGKCQIQHKDLKCPRCGNEVRIIPMGQKSTNVS